MSLLLHLSDLHLGNTPAEDAVGDCKHSVLMVGRGLKAAPTWLMVSI
jgi:hypothetical protein